MSPVERLLIAGSTLAAGASLGVLIRGRLARMGGRRSESFELPAGLVVVTAPYCTRCTNLRARLADRGIRFRTVDAASQPSLLADLGITSAPTLLRVDSSGRITERESRDFSDTRLASLTDAGD